MIPPGVVHPAAKPCLYLSKSGGVRQLSVRARLVNGLWKLLRQDLGDLIDRDVEPGRQLLDRVTTEHLLQLLRGDWQVLSVADPGFHLISETRLLQFGDDGGQTALIAAAQYLAQHNRQNGTFQLSERALEGG
jgi:hypothetical protein